MLKQGPHTGTRSNGAGQAGRAGSRTDTSGWELGHSPGCFAEVPEAEDGERQRGCAGCKGKHHPSS